MLQELAIATIIGMTSVNLPPAEATTNVCLMQFEEEQYPVECDLSYGSSSVVTSVLNITFKTADEPFKAQILQFSDGTYVLRSAETEAYVPVKPPVTEEGVTCYFFVEENGVFCYSK